MDTIASILSAGAFTRQQADALRALLDAIEVVADHGDLTGLSDDDHPQYQLKRSAVTDVVSVGGVVTLDLSLGDYFRLALHENVTSWVITNPPGAGRGFTALVEITQDSTPRTVAKPGTAEGGSLTVSVGSGVIDLLAITSFDNGATLRSSIGKAFS